MSQRWLVLVPWTFCQQHLLKLQPAYSWLPVTLVLARKNVAGVTPVAPNQSVADVTPVAQNQSVADVIPAQARRKNGNFTGSALAA
ncbi:MAG: hypothetical protein HN673_05180 [Rhodospirillales bacterium]|nr:hypothetical protein [Rhodospirillales bacterium]MBT7771238.1 hypothetical protein [Rhodospirillales bacterium]